LGFKELQAMRDASETGGALGQVAVKELDYLQSSKGSLNPALDNKVLTSNLDSISKSYDKALRITEAIANNDTKAINKLKKEYSKEIEEAKKGKVKSKTPLDSSTPDLTDPKFLEFLKQKQKSLGVPLSQNVIPSEFFGDDPNAPLNITPQEQPIIQQPNPSDQYRDRIMNRIKV
jgi:hypothetical protein